jgi:hypothetical protein
MNPSREQSVSPLAIVKLLNYKGVELSGWHEADRFSFI